MPATAAISTLAQAAPGAPRAAMLHVGVLTGVLLIAVLGLMALVVLTLMRRAARRSMMEDPATQRSPPPPSAWQEAGRRAEPMDHDPDVDPLDETR